jgi:GR25 family glycosyltransferase involved in LPS biosynthesis
VSRYVMNRSQIMKILLGFGMILLIFLIFRIKAKHEIKTHRNIKETISLIKNNIKQYNTDNPNKCSVPYPVFYINLDKDLDRRDFMEQQLSKLSANYRRIPGINGKNLKNFKRDEIDGISFINNYPELRPGELGCTLSHILAIATAWKTQMPIVLICEDDCSFDTCGITTSMSDTVKNAPSDWEILQLFTGGLKKDQTDAETSYVRFEPKSTTWSNAAYLINRNGMSRLLSRVGYPFHLTPDSKGIPDYGVADRFIPLLTITYCVIPSILGINTRLESTIHNEHIDPIHVPALYNFLQGVNLRLLQASPWRVHVVKNWDQNWVRTVLPFPQTEKIEQANIIVTNANSRGHFVPPGPLRNCPLFQRNQEGNQETSTAPCPAFIILIDREPFDISDWKVDLVISTKRKESSRLPLNTPNIYLPCYSPSFAEGEHNPRDLLSPKKRFEKTKFCAFAYSNCNSKYPGVETRMKFLKYFQERTGDRIDSWGKCAPNMKLPKDKGTWDNALLYQPYKFVIAFENDYPSGYISEKLTLPMLAGAIPIYFGAEEVSDHFNTKSFVNVRDFASWDDAIDRILQLDNDEKAYQKMLAEPWLSGNRLSEHFAWYDKNLGDFQAKILAHLPKI